MNLLKQKVNKFKRNFILAEYKYCHCNQTLTAKRLDFHRNSFILYINTLNLRKEIAELRRNELRPKGKISHLPIIKNPFLKAVQLYEYEYINNIITKNHGNIALSARELGVQSNALLLKINSFKSKNIFNVSEEQLRKSITDDIDIYINKSRKKPALKIKHKKPRFTKITDKQRQKILELTKREKLSYRKLAKMFNVSHEAIRLTILKENNQKQWQKLIDKAQTAEEVLSLPVKVFDLSFKLGIELSRIKIRTIGDLVNYSNEQLFNVNRIGAVTLNSINNKLKSIGARKGIILELKKYG